MSHGTARGTARTKIHEALFVPRHFGVNNHWPGHSPLMRMGTLVKPSTSNLNSQQETTINITLEFNMNINST